MNDDLKLRLRLLHQLSYTEETFLSFLIDELAKEAALGLHGDGDEDATMYFHVVVIENGEDDSAYMTGDGDTFTIYIDKRMPFGMITDFLIHELAHVHSWERADPDEDHCKEFGKSYALLYRCYLKLYDRYWGTR